ncbi:MAG TPA: response regulator [Pyrinomonadaceae bacterium]
MRILYVEDNPLDADLTARALRKSAPDVEVETVSTIGEALARLARIASDPLELVLTDMRLRDGDGLSLLQHVRENSLPLAVVLITGLGDEETAVAALKARADDYVVKSRDYLDRLPVILESALNHYRADAARRVHPLNILYVEDESCDIESTLHYFAVHAGHLHLDVVHTGPEALAALRPREDGRRYDVLLMSFGLPGLDTPEVFRELRLTRRLDVPAVLLCREEDEYLARQALKLGGATYLLKRPGYLYRLTWELEEAQTRAELLRREAALQASEARNRAILNAIPDPMFVLSRDGTYLDYHATDDRPLLLPPGQLLGKKVTDVLPPQLAADLLRCFERALATDEPVLHEYTLEMPDGVRAYEASIVGCDGDKILSIVRDITERKHAEEALRQTQADLARMSRVTALGELAASIAHEINQPLTSIIGNADICLTWLSEEPPDLTQLREAISDIDSDGHRAAEVLRRIRDLLGKGTARMTPLDINEVVGEVASLLGGAANARRVRMQSRLGTGLPPVLGDRVQLQQVLLNLLINAMDAMSAVEESRRELVVETGEDDDAGNVLVAVRDHGPGLSPADMEKVFGAFYTTKPEGMGMGLSISRSIIRTHGGRLWVEANGGGGACFRFALPPAEASP